MSRQRGWKAAFKRALDFSCAAFALLLLWPVILVVAIAIRLVMGSPVLFRQPRPGKGGRIFHINKFRSMMPPQASDGRPLSETERVTWLGRLLRATNVDELPQLWNILIGDMSLVGPRPLLPQYLSRYTPRQARRHEVTPGLTGLASVKGRNLLSWEEKLEFDVEYVDSWSICLDFKIVILTAVKVMTNEGGRPANGATVEEFLGSARSASGDDARSIDDSRHEN